MKEFWVVCTCLLLSLIIKGQTIIKKWNVGLHGGISQFRIDLGSSFYRFNMWNWLGSICVSRYIFDNVDVNMLIKKGTVGYNKKGGIGNFKGGPHPP